MKTVNELVKHLNELKITQNCGEWKEDLPQEIWEKYFKDVETTKYQLDPEKHRWHETSIDVIAMLDGFLGVRYISTLYSEMSNIGDIFHTLRFYEMEEVKTVTYYPIDE